MTMNAPFRHLAVIDLGSNTAKMIVFAYESGSSFQHLDQLRDVVRLAEGMGAEGRIADAAMARALATLTRFRRYCDARGIEAIVATATSAVRDAVNGPEFLARAEAEAGITLTVLGGEAEAEAGVLAVANSFAERDAIVVDLGGGSVQLSDMRERRFAQGASWPLGAVRATAEFLKSDPPKKKHLKALRSAVRDAIGPWLDARARVHPDAAPGSVPWIGMGGTLRSLAEVWQARERYPLPLLHGYQLPASALHAIAEDLAAMDVAARREVEGLGADRADIIVAGATVLDEILAVGGARGFLVSGQGLREGLFYPHLFVAEPGHLAPDVRIFAARNLMHRYHDDVAHAERVAALSLDLFDALAPELGYGMQERSLLRTAAWLHDIGMAIEYFGHHRHGAYLTLARALPGYDHREQALLADIIRAHRKGKATPEAAPALLREGDLDRLRVLAGILQITEQLERTKTGRVERVVGTLHPASFEIAVLGSDDVSFEIKEAAGRTGQLAAGLGRPVRLHAALGPFA